MWALFSVAHEEYQPRNNLEVLFSYQPSFEQLASAMYQKKSISELRDFELVGIANLLQEKEVTMNHLNTDYRLEKITFGTPLESDIY